jgi:WD40 repeat protein
VNLWDLTTKKSRIRLGHDGSIQALTFSPDCKLLASAALGPTATLWDAGSGEEKTRLKHGSFDPSKDPPMVSVESVIFSPDGNLVATVASDQTVKVWEVKSGKEVIGVKGYVLVFSPKGRTAATAALGDPVKLWDLGTGKERMSLPAGLVTDIAISPDGRTLATGTDDKSVRLWSIGETLK